MRSLSLVAALASIVTVTTARKCQNITVPVTISARNAVFSLKAPATDIEATNFVLGSVQQGKNYTNSLLTGVSLLKPSRLPTRETVPL